MDFTLTFFVIGLALGYGTMRGGLIYDTVLFIVHELYRSAVTPTPEETYAALAPDLRRRVDANKAARLAQDQTDKKREHEVFWAH